MYGRLRQEVATLPISLVAVYFRYDIVGKYEQIWNETGSARVGQNENLANPEKASRTTEGEALV